MPPQVRRTSVLPSGKALKLAEFTSDDLSQIRGVPAGLAPWGAMPGLPKVPAAEKIDVDENGRITGLFGLPFII